MADRAATYESDESPNVSQTAKDVSRQYKVEVVPFFEVTAVVVLRRVLPVICVETDREQDLNHQQSDVCLQ